MANMYRSVLSGGGTAPTGDAVAADVLSGKTFSNASATGITGTMVNNGAVSGVASIAQPYTIPEGYHNGNGQVTAVATGFDCIIGTNASYAFIIDKTHSVRSNSDHTFTFDGFTVNVVNGSAIKFNKACTVYPPTLTPVDTYNTITPVHYNANTNIDLTSIPVGGVVFD